MSKFGFQGKMKLGLLGLAVFILTGCLGSGGSLTNLPEDEVALVKLKIRLGRVDSRSDANSEVLTKGAATGIQVQTLRVTFTSNLGEIIKDTVNASEYLGVNTPTFGDSILVDVRLRAFRWWNIDVETRDQNDSVVHKGSAGPFASKGGGQTVDLTMPLLNSRYMMYEARYQLPSEITSTNGGVTQKIYFYRLMLEIDGDTARDSTSLSSAITQAGSRFIVADPLKLKGSNGKFFFKPYDTTASRFDTATHVQTYDYLRAGTYTFKLSAFGYLEGDSVGQTTPRLLYQGKSEIDVVQSGSTGAGKEETIVLDWMGPGSDKVGADTTKGPPGSENWNGIALEVKINRVKSGGVSVGIIADFPDN